MSKPVTRRTRGPRKGSEGFKLLEVLVSMAILMIGAVGIVQLHGTIIRGIASSEDTSLAMDIATQRLDDLSIIGSTGLPACIGGINGPGCQAGIGTQNFTAELAPAAGYACTRFVDSAQILMAGGAGEIPEGSRFRVDTVVTDHPDLAQFPEGQLVTVSVCWLDISNDVRQVQLRRYVVPEA